MPVPPLTSRLRSAAASSPDVFEYPAVEYSNTHPKEADEDMSADRRRPVVLSPSDANDWIPRILREEDPNHEILEGYVSKRRAIGRSLRFWTWWSPLPLPREMEMDVARAMRLVTRRRAAARLARARKLPRRRCRPSSAASTVAASPPLNPSSAASFDAYHKILQPGTRVRLVGRAGPSRNPGEALLFVTAAEYVRPNANPQHLRNVLRLAGDGALDLGKVAKALGMSRDSLGYALSRTREGEDGSPAETSCGELARDILSSWSAAHRDEGHRLLDPSKLMGNSGQRKRAMLPQAPRRFATPPGWIGKEVNVDETEIPISVETALEIYVRGVSDEFEGAALSRTPVTISAWVQNRRRYADLITVLEVVDDYAAISLLQGTDTVSSGIAAAGIAGREGDEERRGKNEDNDTRARNAQVRALWRGRAYCVLHPNVTLHMVVPPEGAAANGENNSTSSTAADAYGNVLSSGARALMRGYVTSDSDSSGGGSGSGSGSGDTATLWVTQARLLSSSWRPSVVRTVLDLLHRGEMDVEEAAGALNLPGGYRQAEDIASGGTELTERQWMVAELSKELQGERSRIGMVSEEMLRVLDKYGRHRERFPLRDVTAADKDSGPAGQSELPQGAALRTSSSGSRWQRAKRPQLEWMMRQIEEVVRSHPDYGLRPLRVADVGGGKGHLANLIAGHFGDGVVIVHVVDISRLAIKNGIMRARRRHLENIRYEANDASAADMEGTDLVVALHACGALSDVAIGHAAAEVAAFVVCPCCYRSNPQLKVRMPSAAVGGVEASSSVGGGRRRQSLGSVAEWLDVDANELEVLKRAAEVQGDIGMSGRAMHSICALRAETAEGLHMNRLSSRTSEGRIDSKQEYSLSVEIRTFPIGFSTRNLCLVGKLTRPLDGLGSDRK